MALTSDSLVIHYARELLAEHKAKIAPLKLDMASLEGRLAVVLDNIIDLLEHP